MNAEKKPWWKSRTLWFNAVIAGLSALEANAYIVQPFVQGNIYAYFVIVLTVGNAMIRLVTSQGLSK